MFDDDRVLGHINQTTGQVTGVRCLQRRIGETLTGTVGGVEVLENRQTLFKVRGNRGLDDLTGRFRHQTAHTGQLTDLCW